MASCATISFLALLLTQQLQMLADKGIIHGWMLMARD